MTPHGPICLPNYLQTFPSLKENSGEDPANHVMTFHLWCSSNNIMDESSLKVISVHTHWSINQSLFKEETTKEQCLDWFLRSLISILAKDVGLHLYPK
jgi:hypothetical protein